MKKFRLYFRSETDDANPKFIYREDEPKIGTTIRIDETGMHHCVYNKVTQKTGVRLDLAESATSHEEAKLLAEQDGLLKET